MNNSMIPLLHKKGMKVAFTNYRLIMLLNIPHKILAKALQIRLKPLLPNMINKDQTTFLSM